MEPQLQVAKKKKKKKFKEREDGKCEDWPNISSEFNNNSINTS